MKGSGGGADPRAPGPLTPAPLPWERGKAASFAEAAARLAGLTGALLGWRPDEFWRATPAEVATVLGVLTPPREAGLTRSELEGLMKRFPD